MTENKEFQSYLMKLPKKHSKFLCKFKCANHHLPIISGRFNSIRLEERLCTDCGIGEVGDEFHYLFKCSLFHNSRKMYLKPYYYRYPNTYKMTELFASNNKTVLLNLAKFIIEIMKHFK